MGKSVMSEPNRVSVEVNYDGDNKDPPLSSGLQRKRMLGSTSARWLQETMRS
ncbi:Uncharacterized protein FKW44_012428 [Caligus rogercresseyi]|uniref:Uncharacterized protein n=1 Tax=Caligus rogercresseyi TaxID=217165 RepID=A0A7T8HJZ3_CALRO|nr:Uncharacterized protein FKW44_012428 [Caligus rogercresseyi]